MRFLSIIVSLLLSCSALADDTFQYIIRLHGYDPATVKDLTRVAKIKLPEPNCAYVNITGISQMPTQKNQNLHAWLECYDGNGNYFKKRVTLSAQGGSSMNHPKKNVSVKLYEEAWEEGKTTDITFGNWVKQDGFHLKAFYIDLFRGCGKIAYDIYDDITSDREQPLPWQRAGISTASENATCHPNGFPCYVYLNDKFYGLFVWSLKKSHKNMGQEKDNALHIHLDGILGDETIFNGNIDWSKFDVRTPKELYCVDTTQTGGTIGYKLYDGDKPTELIDDSMPYYDANNPGHVLTNKVKQSIVKLSKYTALLKKSDTAHPDAATFRALYEQCFDTQGLTDYLVHSLVTNNYDGHWKNWQWFTYDGIKWYVEPYDLDCTFGHQHMGSMLFPPEWNGHVGPYYQIPANDNQKLFLKYFFDDLKERYIALREKQLIDAQTYISYIKTWTERIGTLGYELEYKKWPNSPCIRETIISPNWTTENNWANFSTYPAYSPETTYHAGDKCKDGYRIWTATATTKGVRPYRQLGETDSMERTEGWIRERISLYDKFFGFNPDDTDGITKQMSDEKPDTRKVIIGKNLYIIKNNEVYSAEGIRAK